MFEVEGGHGWTLWTRRRIEDTRPSIVDPVSVLDAAHGSHRVTQKKRSSPPHQTTINTIIDRRFVSWLLGCGCSSVTVTSSFASVVFHFWSPLPLSHKIWRQIRIDHAFLDSIGEPESPLLRCRKPELRLSVGWLIVALLLAIVR